MLALVTHLVLVLVAAVGVAVAVVVVAAVVAFAVMVPIVFVHSQGYQQIRTLILMSRNESPDCDRLWLLDGFFCADGAWLEN